MRFELTLKRLSFFFSNECPIVRDIASTERKEKERNEEKKREDKKSRTNNNFTQNENNDFLNIAFEFYTFDIIFYFSKSAFCFFHFFALFLFPFN